MIKYPHANEAPLNWLEGHLQAIRTRTTTESWEELTKKAHKLCTHSQKLEPFAIERCGLLGEIKTAAKVDSGTKGTTFAKNNLDISLLLINPCPF